MPVTAESRFSLSFGGVLIPTYVSFDGERFSGGVFGRCVEGVNPCTTSQNTETPLSLSLAR